MRSLAYRWVTRQYQKCTGPDRPYTFRHAALPRYDVRVPDERPRLRTHSRPARGARARRGNSAGGSRRARLQHLHDPREARPAARRIPRQREGAEDPLSGHDRRRGRLLRRGSARPDLRALPLRRRRLRAGHDPPPRRLARRRRSGRRAFGVRHGGRAPLLSRPRHTPGAAVPGMDPDLDGLQLRLLLLHRARRSRAGGESAAR